MHGEKSSFFLLLTVNVVPPVKLGVSYPLCETLDCGVSLPTVDICNVNLTLHVSVTNVNHHPNCLGSVEGL